MNALFQGYVGLRQFLGRALWLGQARGLSAAIISSNENKNKKRQKIENLNILLFWTFCNIGHFVIFGHFVFFDVLFLDIL